MKKVFLVFVCAVVFGFVLIGCPTSTGGGGGGDYTPAPNPTPQTKSLEGTWKNDENYYAGDHLGYIASNIFRFDGNNWQQLVTGNNYGNDLFVDYKGTFTFTNTQIAMTYIYYSENHGTSWKELATSSKPIYQSMSGGTGYYPYEIDDTQTPNILKLWDSAPLKDLGALPRKFNKQ